MNLADALYRGLTGRSPATAGVWRHVVAEARRAYRHATKPPPGLSARTWQRIRADPAGRRTPATVRALVAVQRSQRFRTARRRHARGKRIRFRAEVQVSGDRRVRAITVARWIDTTAQLPDRTPMPAPADLEARVISLMQEGEHAAAAALLTDALSGSIRQAVTVGETEWAVQLGEHERGPGE